MIIHYVRIALRNALRQKSVFLLNAAGLAIGLASCILIALYVQDELSYDHHNEKADRIYRVVEGKNAKTAPALATALKADFPGIADAVRIQGTTGVWLMKSEDKLFYETEVCWADQSLFNFFTLPLVKGNPANALTAPFSVVISSSIARKYFGDKDPMGKVIIADNGYASLTVTGVMQDVPPQSHIQTGFFISLATGPKVWAPTSLFNWDDRSFYTYILLKDGYTQQNLEENLPAFVNRHLTEQLQAGRSIAFSLQLLTRIHLYSQLDNEIGVNGSIANVLVLIAIATVVLLIACINFMNLATARSLYRVREVSVRKVVGVVRTQLMTQFFGETLVTTGFALGIAILMVHNVLPYFNDLSGKDLSLAFDNNLTTWSGFLGLPVFVGLVSGSYPALILSSFSPVSVLKGGQRKGFSRAGFRTSLVVGQFAISVTLMILTGVLSRQLAYVQDSRHGFTKEHLLVIPGGMQQISQKYPALKQAFLENPKVVSVASARSIPGRSGSRSNQIIVPIQIEDISGVDPISAEFLYVSPGFLETVGIRLLAGKEASSSRDSQTGALNTLVLNETAAKQLGLKSAAEAVGVRIELEGKYPATVAGVVEDFQMRSLHQPIGPVALAWNANQDGFMVIRIAAGGEKETLGYLETRWKELLPDFPFIWSFMEDDLQKLYQADLKLSHLCSLLTMLAVALTCLGLLGLVAYTAERRTKEIGIRKVLGASRFNLLVLLSKDFVQMALFATIVAWPIAYLLANQWLQGFAYRIDLPLAPFFMAGVIALFLTLATTGFYALRTARMNPVEMLRDE